MATPHTARPITARMLAAIFHDGVMAAIAMQAAIWLRYTFANRPVELLFMWQASAFYGLVAMIVFIALGVHRSLWRYTSFDDLIKILQAVTISTFAFVPVLFFITRLAEFPRSAPFIQWPLFVALVVGSRVLMRLLKGGNLSAFGQGRAGRVPILVVAPADQAESFVRMAQRLGSEGFPYWIAGLIDTDGASVGHIIRGKRVFGDVRSLAVALERMRRLGEQPQKVVIADPDMEGAQVSALLDECEKLGLSLARAPRFRDFHSGGPEPVELRPVDLRDLLGRPQNVHDQMPVGDLIAGRRVLITGAGGTIGSELTRQVASFAPARLTLLDSSEHNLYLIDLELNESFREVPRRSLLGDVRDVAQIRKIVADDRPDIVFHAAALKHVPLVESNVIEGVLTNVVGSRNVVDASIAAGVATMVMISTDKAVNPTSVMGATKRIAELYCQAQDVSEAPTRIVTVRFGNVLGSTGSVVPLFQRQLERGGPLTVTHPEATRYFMTTREAVELVLQSAMLDVTQEGAPSDGHIYVLDMGKPVRIVDLATRMIRLAGLKPHEDIAIEFIGLRPGEKLHETLFHEQEKLVPTHARGILLARPRVITLATLSAALAELEASARARDEAALHRLIRSLVPEFEGAGREPARGTTTRVAPYA